MFDSLTTSKIDHMQFGSFVLDRFLLHENVLYFDCEDSMRSWALIIHKCRRGRSYSLSID